MKKHFLLFFLLSILIATTGVSQNKIVFSDAPVRVGDEPEWRKKDYSGGGWYTIQLNRDWESQGLGNHDGFGYYRMSFTLPSEMLKNSHWKDSLLFYMGKIDDADEVYLNGTLIGKTGRFPNDNSGYKTAFDVERFYKVATNNPVLQWDKENTLAVRVYDGDGAGGMYEGFPYIRMIDLFPDTKTLGNWLHPNPEVI